MYSNLLYKIRRYFLPFSRGGKVSNFGTFLPLFVFVKGEQTLMNGGEILESRFQHKLIKMLEDIFPGCIILKNDPGYKKNIPDLTVFWKNHYALLEVKRSERAFKESKKEDGRKNQEYYVNLFNEWGSFASFVYPENVDQVLSQMKEAFS